MKFNRPYVSYVTHNEPTVNINLERQQIKNVIAVLILTLHYIIPSICGCITNSDSHPLSLQ